MSEGGNPDVPTEVQPQGDESTVAQNKEVDSGLPQLPALPSNVNEQLQETLQEVSSVVNAVPEAPVAETVTEVGPETQPAKAEPEINASQKFSSRPTTASTQRPTTGNNRASIVPESELARIERLMADSRRPDAQYENEDDNDNKNDLENFKSESTDLNKYGPFIDGDNPLVKRVQEVIFKQLSTTHEKLELELREKEEALKQTLKKREEVGVELYTLQQQLVRFQTILDQTETDYAKTRKQREELERQLQKVVQEHTQRDVELKSRTTNFEKQREELEKLSRALKQIELYQEDLESQLKIVKTSSMKAETDMREREVEKKRQDFVLDSMTDQLQELEEKKLIFEQQIRTQRAETKALMDMVQEATTETEAIQFEKKQLLQQWKTALITLQKKEKNVAELESNIQIARDNVRSLDAKIMSFKASIKQLAEHREMLNGVVEKTTTQIDYFNRQTNEIEQKMDELRREYGKYNTQLNANEEKSRALMKQQKLRRQQLSSLETQIDFTSKEIRKVEESIADTLNNQLFLKKGNQGSKRDTAAIRQRIAEKETTLVTIKNEMAQIHLNSLQANDRIDSLNKRLAELNLQYKSTLGMIEKREVDMKRAADDIVKKQTEIDMLNKRLDQLTAKTEESNSPLESIVKNLSREITEKEKECQTLQSFWMRAQNELVLLLNKSSETSDEILKLTMKLTVLKRKKMVMDGQFESETKMITQYKRSIKNLQKQIEKLSGLIFNQQSLSQHLEERNFGLEQEIRHQLKQGEMENLILSQSIEESKQEREKALAGLVESEQQIMLWEKKIQLAKETQAALDPNLGASEIKDMEKEIHRMSLRYQSILKVQEKMVIDMERAVERRQVIGNRTKGKAKGSAQMILERTIQEISKKIKQTVYDINECERDFEQLLTTQDRVESKFIETAGSIKQLENKEKEILECLEKEVFAKSLLTQATLILQKMQKRFALVRDKKYVYLFKDSDERKMELSKQKGQLRQLKGVVKDIEEQCDQELIRNMFQPLYEFLDVKI